MSVSESVRQLEGAPAHSFFVHSLQVMKTASSTPPPKTQKQSSTTVARTGSFRVTPSDSEESLPEAESLAPVTVTTGSHPRIVGISGGRMVPSARGNKSGKRSLLKRLRQRQHDTKFSGSTSKLSDGDTERWEQLNTAEEALASALEEQKEEAQPFIEAATTALSSAIKKDAALMCLGVSAASFSAHAQESGLDKSLFVFDEAMPDQTAGAGAGAGAGTEAGSRAAGAGAGAGDTSPEHADAGNTPPSPSLWLRQAAPRPDNGSSLDGRCAAKSVWESPHTVIAADVVRTFGSGPSHLGSSPDFVDEEGESDLGSECGTSASSQDGDSRSHAATPVMEANTSAPSSDVSAAEPGSVDSVQGTVEEPMDSGGSVSPLDVDVSSTTAAAATQVDAADTATAVTPASHGSRFGRFSKLLRSRFRRNPRRTNSVVNTAAGTPPHSEPDPPMAVEAEHKMESELEDAGSHQSADDLEHADSGSEGGDSWSSDAPSVMYCINKSCGLELPSVLPGARMVICGECGILNAVESSRPSAGGAVPTRVVLGVDLKSEVDTTVEASADSSLSDVTGSDMPPPSCVSGQAAASSAPDPSEQAAVPSPQPRVEHHRTAAPEVPSTRRRGVSITEMAIQGGVEPERDPVRKALMLRLTNVLLAYSAFDRAVGYCQVSSWMCRFSGGILTSCHPRA